MVRHPGARRRLRLHRADRDGHHHHHHRRRHRDGRDSRRRPRVHRYRRLRRRRGSCHHRRHRWGVRRDRHRDRHRDRDRRERVGGRRDAPDALAHRRHPDGVACCRARRRGEVRRRDAGRPDGVPAGAGSAGRPAGPRRTGCCRRAGSGRRASAQPTAPGRAADRVSARGWPARQRPEARARRGAAGGSGGAEGLGAGAFSGAAALAGEPFPSALTFSGAGFAPPNDSRSRRATGASTVEDADLTNSPCSLSRARTSLLVTPSSLANSCTRALPATTSPVWRRQRW